MSIYFIMSEKAKHSEMQVVPRPSKWFTLEAHVMDSQASRFLCRVRAGNLGLGNRYRMCTVPNMQVALFCKQSGKSENPILCARRSKDNVKPWLGRLQKCCYAGWH